MSTLSTGKIMEKTVGAFEVRRSFGRILQEVATKGDRVVVERHGEPIAAVVPIDVYNQWKRSRSEFFERMRRASERANLSPEEADQLAAEAVKAIRAQDSE
jgi:prevent-host-death family protein